LVGYLLVNLRYTTRVTRASLSLAEHHLDDHVVCDVVAVHVEFVFQFLAHAEKSDLPGFYNASRLLLF